ncbi:MAG: hypothetical protein V1851_00575 [Patescibacteria group bacterium]
MPIVNFFGNDIFLNCITTFFLYAFGLAILIAFSIITASKLFKKEEYYDDIPVTKNNKLYSVDNSLVDFARQYKKELEDES